MLYQTHHPLFLPFSSSSSSSSKLLSSPSLSPSATATATATTFSQVEKEMECMMKGASLKPEMMVGFAPKQVTYDDFTNFNPQNGVSFSGEDLFVDQLLNLNNEDSTEQVNEEEEEEQQQQRKYDDRYEFLLVVKDEPLEENKQVPPNINQVSTFVSPPLETECNREDFGSVLSVPAEEADLEWLSNFVEESFSQFSTPYPTTLGSVPVSEKPKPEPVSRVYKAPCFTPPPALSKSRRSKRARTGGRVWSMSLADTSSISSPSSPSTAITTTTSSYSPRSSNTDLAHSKKHRKREASGAQRKCSHCGVQKTPQWRTGPMGAKTLCNACGVRYKSGRLLPEYRPACSPTFSSELHSNNHRKVLEMRKKKELTMSGRPDPT